MRYAQIRNFDISNGEGIGIALFVQGCHFHCRNCFNKETWDFEGGKPWTQQAYQQFVDLADRPYIKRVSILGGEPLEKRNLRDVYDLVVALKNKYPDKTIWLYTGYTWDYIFSKNSPENTMRRNIVAMCDVVVDGQFEESLADVKYPWAGSTNQRVIRVHDELVKIFDEFKK